MALHSRPTAFRSSWIGLIIAFSISLAPMLNMAQHCYAPNGTVLDGFGICHPALSDSVCCKIHEACQSYGLCSNVAGFLYRGGCTDRSFKSKNCPAYCIDDSKKSWVNECAKADDRSGLYCCDTHFEGDCCTHLDSFLPIGPLATSVPVVTATPGKSITLPSSSKTTHSASTRTTHSASTRTTKSASTTTSSQSTTSSSSDASSTTTTPASTSTNSASTSTNPASTDTATASQSAVPPSSGRKIGVGVGVGFGALTIIATLLSFIM